MHPIAVLVVAIIVVADPEREQRPRPMLSPLDLSRLRFWDPTPPLPPGIAKPCPDARNCYVVCQRPFLEHVSKYFGPLLPAFHVEGKYFSPPVAAGVSIPIGLRSPSGALREIGIEPWDILVRLGEETLTYGVPLPEPVQLPDLSRAFPVGTREITARRGDDHVPVRVRLRVKDCSRLPASSAQR
jgi:hypothetical protein